MKDTPILSLPKIALTIALLIVVVAGGVLSYRILSRDTNPIPASIRQDLTFSPFVLPIDAKNYTTRDYKFDTAEGKVQILSSIIQIENGPTISVSQYTQPNEFTEVPEFKDRFLTNIAKQYDTVQTSNGTIYLGRMTLQGNKQLGVMLERGLIVFFSPDRELEKAQWRNLGDQLDIQKVIN